MRKALQAITGGVLVAGSTALVWSVEAQALLVDQGIKDLAVETGSFWLARTNSAASSIVEQSFVPSLPTIGFVQLWTYDGTPGNGIGATLIINVRAGTPSGSIVGTSLVTSLPDGSSGYYISTNTFFFNPPVQVVPGLTYFLEPLIQNGDNWRAAVPPALSYTLGSVFVGGTANEVYDLWFREGVIMPQLSLTLVTNQALQLSWCSLTNETYSVQRTTNLITGFTDLATNVVATPPTNVYVDRSATNAGPYLYRVKVE